MSHYPVDAPERGPFFVFDSPQYYPGGGVSDMQGVFPTLDEALAACAEKGTEWENPHVAVFTDTGAVWATVRTLTNG